MADIPTRAPQRGWMWQAIWDESAARWQGGVYWVSGGLTEEQSSPDMTLQADEIVTCYGTTAAGNVTIAAADATLARMDVIYVNTSGAFTVHKGDNLAVLDSLGNYDSGTRANWQQLIQPYPKASLPDGVPLYLVYVAPGVTSITTTDLMPIASKGPMPPTIASSGDGVVVHGPTRITHDGGASQAIVTTPAFCEIESVAIVCAEAPDGTLTVNLGWSGDTDALASNAEIPIVLNAKKLIKSVSEITSATGIIATVGGSGTVGEWDVWIKYAEFSAS